MIAFLLSSNIVLGAEISIPSQQTIENNWTVNKQQTQNKAQQDNTRVANEFQNKFDTKKNAFTNDWKEESAKLEEEFENTARRNSNVSLPSIDKSFLEAPMDRPITKILPTLPNYTLDTEPKFKVSNQNEQSIPFLNEKNEIYLQEKQLVPEQEKKVETSITHNKSLQDIPPSDLIIYLIVLALIFGAFILVLLLVLKVKTLFKKNKRVDIQKMNYKLASIGKYLPEGYQLFKNIKIHAAGHSVIIEYVIIGPCGVILLNELDLKGILYVNPAQWVETIGDIENVIKSPCQYYDQRQKVVRWFLKDFGFKDVPVFDAVVIKDNKTKIKGTDPRVFVATIYYTLEWIMSLKPKVKSKIVPEIQRQFSRLC